MITKKSTSSLIFLHRTLTAGQHSTTHDCFSKIQTGFIFLVPAHQGSPRPLNGCVCVTTKMSLITFAERVNSSLLQQTFAVLLASVSTHWLLHCIVFYFLARTAVLSDAVTELYILWSELSRVPSVL